MKKINLLAVLVAGVFVAACNGGGSSGGSSTPTPTPTPTPTSALTVSITPANVITGVGAVVPLQVNAIANVDGITDVAVDLSQLAADTNFNTSQSAILCPTVATADTNSCFSNLTLSPSTDVAQKILSIPYAYKLNGIESVGSIQFTYDVQPGQIVDGVAINTNYVYGTTNLIFTNTNSAAKTVQSVAIGSGLNVVNDQCTGKLVAAGSSCTVTVSPTATSNQSTLSQGKSLKKALQAGSGSVTLNYSDGSNAVYIMNITSVSYQISNVDTQNGYVMIRYKWQNPSLSSGSSLSNNRDLDIKQGFIGSGNFAQFESSFLGFGFYNQNTGSNGMPAGYSASDALNQAFLAWAGDTISGSTAGSAEEDVLIQFSQLNQYQSNPGIIQIPLAAHWYSRYGTTDNNFTVVIDAYPAGTVFTASNENSNKTFQTTATPSSSYNGSAWTSIVNSQGGKSGQFDTFGTVTCNVATNSCSYQ